MSTLTVVTLKERPDLAAAVADAETEGFPEFLLHDPVWEATLPPAMERYPECQLFLMEDDEPVFVGNAVRFPWDGDPESLPAGTHAALELSLECSIEDATTLCGVQGVALGKGKGSGRSEDLMAAFQDLARRHDWRCVIPVRTLVKDQYPLIPMADYLTWQSEGGEAFDPWLRIQERVGGRRLTVVEDALVIEAPVRDWEAWTELAMPTSGQYVISGGQSPLVVDRERGTGRYSETHVWYEYPISSSDG